MEEAVVNKNIEEFISRSSGDFSIEKMCDVDYEKLLAFNMTVYEGEFNAARFADREKIKRMWKWKYQNNPASRKRNNFGWLASYKGSFIGQFHFIPADVKIGSRYYRGAWGSDLAVLKAYRNMGLSAFLIQHARNELPRDFALFLLGGMNENSYGVFKKSGFINLGKIPRYVKILDLKSILICYGIPRLFSSMAQKALDITDKIFSLKEKMPDKNINTEIADGFNNEFEIFWNSVSEYYRCIAKRDPGFLKWRYTDQPLWPYTILKVKRQNRIKGFAALREGDIKSGPLTGKKIGIISDILLDPRDRESAHRLLIATKDFFRNKKVLFIKCDILNCHIERTLGTAGFIKIRPKYWFMLDVYKSNIPSQDAKFAVRKKNWFVAWGDSDLDFD